MDIEETNNEINITNKRRAVECPHCNEKFFIEFQIQIDGTKSEFSDKDWRESLNPKELSFLNKAIDSGLIDAFKQTAEVVKADQMPRNFEKFFFSWMKQSKEKMIPGFALEFYKKEFPQTQISVIGGQGILCVLANKQIKCFVPQETIIGTTIKQSSGNGTNLKTTVNETDLLIWKRTRLGYVLKGSIFESELKSISIGSFAKPRIEIKNRW